jgi:transposase InsO family protein
MPWKEINVMNQRVEFVMRAYKEGNFRALCHEYGISPKTGYKWLERFQQHGTSGLEDASRRPNGHARQVAEDIICEIVRLKKDHPAWGPKKIRALYARTHAQVPSESTFKRLLDKAGWVEHRKLRRRESAGRLFRGRKAEKPNDIWTVDFKGWWYGANRQRCEPLTVRDEFSRFVLEVRAVPNARTETIRDCFEKLFQRHGLPAAIRSDNGAPFASRSAVLGLSRLSVWWLVLGIDLERGVAHRTTPRTNASISTSRVNSKAAPAAMSKLSWINGASNTTRNVPTKPYNSARPLNFIRNRNALTKARPKIWNTQPI